MSDDIAIDLTADADPTPKARTSGAQRKKPGRKPKARHETPETPVDGDYDMFAVVNQDPGYVYATVGDDYRGLFAARGYVPEAFGPKSARYRFSLTEPKDGQEQKNPGGTLMKIRRDLHDRKVEREKTIARANKVKNDQMAIEGDKYVSGGAHLEESVTTLGG